MASKKNPALPIIEEEKDIRQYLSNEISSQTPDVPFAFDTSFSKTNINMQKLFGLDANKARLLLNPESSIRKTYILLDSKYANKINADRTVFTWDFQNNNNTEAGSVNAIGPIRDVTSIKIMDFFLLLTDSKYYNDQMLFTVYIPEFQSQSFLGPENRRFHFAGRIWTDNGVVTAPTYQITFRKKSDVVGAFQALYLYGDGNDGIYDFQKPMTTINTISLSFGSPYQLVSMPQDTFSFTSPSAASPFVIRTTVPHGIPAGTSTRISILVYNTANNVANERLIYMMLNHPGLTTWVGLADMFNVRQLFIYPPNTYSAIEFPSRVGAFRNGTVFIDRYRFYVPLEISYKTALNDL